MSSSPRSSSPPPLFTSSSEPSPTWPAEYSSSPPAAEPGTFGHLLPSSFPDYADEKPHAIETREATRLHTEAEVLDDAEIHPDATMNASAPGDESNVVKEVATLEIEEDLNEQPVLVLDEIPLHAAPLCLQNEEEYARLQEICEVSFSGDDKTLASSDKGERFSNIRLEAHAMEPFKVCTRQCLADLRLMHLHRKRKKPANWCKGWSKYTNLPRLLQ